ncbi:MAG: hypothetical protein ACKV2O_14095 [Acidimicrobiales bacterium]
MAKAGAVGLVCSATALALVMALSALGVGETGTTSATATAAIGVVGASNSGGTADPTGGQGTANNGNGTGTGTDPATSTNPTGGSRPIPGSTAGRGSPSGPTTPGVPGTGTATNPPGTAPVVNGTTAPPQETALATSRCTDSSGDQSAEGVGDIDLVEVTLSRNSTGLTVHFGLSAALNEPTTSATPTMSSWQILIAEGSDVVYAFTVSSVGGAWETSLVDFASPDGDRFGATVPASGQAIDVFVPNADLPRLPDRFTWWATSLTDRLISQGLFANDDCPTGSGVAEAGLALPPESRRASLG